MLPDKLLPDVWARIEEGRDMMFYLLFFLLGVVMGGVIGVLGIASWAWHEGKKRRERRD